MCQRVMIRSLGKSGDYEIAWQFSSFTILFSFVQDIGFTIGSIYLNSLLLQSFYLVGLLICLPFSFHKTY